MPGFKPVDARQSFPALEEEVLARWRERNVFERSLELREDAPVWSFYEGPPTANGRPGSHHVLSRAFKDIYPRFKAMRGFHVPRKAGWDCHGLPVELEVEKELGISSKQEIEEFGIAEFNRKCRESVYTYVEDWNRLTERIGFWLDLDDAYFTLHDDYIESVWWSLRKLWDDEMLYEGHRVSPYCPRCGTALSSHEVALGYQEVEDPSAFVQLELVEAPGEGAAENGSPQAGDRLLIWTTTPWTLPGNYAVAVAADVTYVRIREGDQVLILAEALIEKVLGEEAKPTVLARFPGSSLVGARYAAPIFELTDRPAGTNPVITGDFVTTDDGTGLVHLAPAYGEDDYNAIREAGLYDPADSTQTLYNPVDLDGNFTEQVSGFAGRFVKDPEVTTALLDDLKQRGLLFKAESYTHSYPHCWRCGTPLLYYAKASWYIKTSAARDRMLANNQQINWQPPHIKEGRFGRWLENNVDWALSRDRYWGTPLPIWQCEKADCEKQHCIGSVAELKERALGDVPEDLHRPYIDEVELECDCGGRMRRLSSVIDTWYDSGAMPFAQHHYPFENQDLFEERFPADFICEAIDQTRGWFYTLLAESTLLFDGPSYLNCVCLGLLLDAEGQKMSKSRGNVIAPWEVIEAHGADAFRWYLFTAQQPWSGYRFSIDGVGESLRQFLLTLWNTYSFWVLYANAEGLGPDDFGTGVPQTGDALDRWVLSRLQSTTTRVIEELDAFDCTAAGREIAAFVEELSNWYVRLSRRRFWDGDRAAFATLRHCLLEVAALLAPFTPFLADELHLNLAHGAAGYSDVTTSGASDGTVPDSVHLRDFPEPATDLIDRDLEIEMEAVRRTVELGRAARAQAKAKVRQPLRRAVIVANDIERAAIEAHADLVRGELNVKELDFVTEEGELVRYSVKPNFRTLGPRFGPQMPQVAAAVAALNAGSVAEALEQGSGIGISVEGHEHELGADDVSLVLEPLEGYQVEAEAGHAVALALDLDEELIAEGRAREIVHAIQSARKEAGLEVTDRIALRLTGAPELIAAAETHEDYIAAETLATSFVTGEGDGASTGEVTSETRIEKLPLTISLSRSTAA